jgi:uncharacterized protein YjeT (DUF2065 family)
MWRKRIIDSLALMMIGDGLLAAVIPNRYARLWNRGPRFWRAMIRPFVECEQLTRWTGVAELVAGVLLVHGRRDDFDRRLM